MQRILNKFSVLVPISEKGLWFLFFVLGFGLLAIRNPDPFIHQVLYTEDGQWIGMALTKGWFYAMVYAKEGYLVWGNLLFLWLSVTSSEIVCGDTFRCLPLSVSLWSFAFYSFAVLLAVISVGQSITTRWRIVLWLMLLLIPIGSSSNEVIGRISNIGFLVVPISVFLFYLRSSEQTSRGKKSIWDVLLLLCAATNPVVIPVLLAFLANAFWKMRKNIRSCVKEYVMLLLGMLGVLVLMLALVDGGGSITGAMKGENLIEVAIARSLLYPFVFPVYNKLSDSLVLLLFSFWVGLLFFFYKKIEAGSAKRLFELSAVALLIFWFVVIVTRQSLTEQLGGYQTTFPDRYFLGQNYLALFLTVFGAVQVMGQQKQFYRWVGQVCIASLILVYTVTLPKTLEVTGSRFPIQTGLSFVDQLCSSAVERFPVLDGSTVVYVPTYFKGWTIEMTERQLMASAMNNKCFTGSYSSVHRAGK